MAENRSIVEDLMHRRVPQIVGMYVAAVWLVIELGDWVTERFSFPPNLTSFVFVAMLVMLPAVALFAWNHGAPGKDRWTRSERILIPANVLVAAGVLYLVSPTLVVEAATETVRLEDETGVVQEFEVARQGYHREVIGFFWENVDDDTELDWLSYGLPLMLAHDLNRVSPVLSVVTPFDSRGVQSNLRRRGYEAFVDEPRGLAIEITRERRSSALILGAFSRDGNTRRAEITLIDADTGDELGSHAFEGSDWLTAVDDLTVAILQYLDVQPSDNQSDDPVSQHLTDSIEAVRHYSAGEVAIHVANDYPGAIAEYRSAVEIDPGFAEASGQLARAFYASGDVEAAQSTLTEALRNSYRLSESSKFMLKVSRYLYNGDFERGERVLDLWTQVQPNSTQALSELARIARINGTDESLSKASEAYDRLLELSPNDLDIFREKAEVEAQRGNYEAAAAYLTNFLDQDPDNARALVQLADVYQAQGDLDAAQSAFEDAAVLSDDPLRSELGLARLEARRGLYREAEIRLSKQPMEQFSPQQRLWVLAAQIEIAVVRGQISRGLELHAQASEIARTLMPPVIHLVSMENQRSTFLALLGRTDEAVAMADEIVAQLQPPMSNYLNLTYTGIYAAANDRDNFREWADKTRAMQDQLPDILAPMIAIETARLAVWDEQFGTAISELDRAGELLGKSFMQQFQSNLSLSSMSVGMAELYLEAGEIDKCLAELEVILKVFPSNAHAKLVAAKAEIAGGDRQAAERLLEEALEVWADGDEDYIYRAEAVALLDSA